MNDLLEHYRKFVKETAVFPDEYAIVYPALALCGEAGELANKIKKWMRAGKPTRTQREQEDLIQEVGDILWYCEAFLQDACHVSLATAIKYNMIKLQKRRNEGTLAAKEHDDG